MVKAKFFSAARSVREAAQAEKGDVAVLGAWITPMEVITTLGPLDQRRANVINGRDNKILGDWGFRRERVREWRQASGGEGEEKMCAQIRRCCDPSR